MAERFRDYQAELAPTWLQRRWGSAWLTSFGLLKDGIVESARQAARAVIIDRAPDDALVYIGQDRDLERVPDESDADYRARLREAWNIWEGAGTDAGIIAAFATLGITAHVRRNNQWDWDGRPGNIATYWARMWIVLDVHPFTSAPTCGAGPVCGDGSICGLSGASLEYVQATRRAGRKWKSSHAWALLIVPTQTTLFPTKICGDGAICGDGSICGGDAAYVPISG